MASKFAAKNSRSKKLEPIETPAPAILASVMSDASATPQFTPWILDTKPSSMLNKSNKDMSIETWVKSEEVGKAINFVTLTPEQQDRIRTIAIPVSPDAALTQEQLQHLKNTIVTFLKRRGIAVISMDDLHSSFSELNVVAGKNSGSEPVARILEFRLDSYHPISDLGINGDKLRNALAELSSEASRARKTGIALG